MTDNQQQYDVFADVYEILFDDSLYLSWFTYATQTMQAFDKFLDDQEFWLDLGAGGGQFAILMVQAGYPIKGLDLSEKMVNQAKANAKEAKLDLTFWQDDMTSFKLDKQAAVISCFCDTFNYLKDAQAVKATFTHIFQQLTEGGLFMFDVHSVYQMNEIYPDSSFVVEWDDAVFTWTSDQFRGENTIDHTINVFVQNEDSQDYQRFEEMHYEQTLTIEEYLNILTQVGFKNIRVTADFTQEAADDQSKRIFFAAEK
ncbi:class I SAM-dependent methyltransferase [Aerococcaceae bacterium 50-4]